MIWLPYRRHRQSLPAPDARAARVSLREVEDRIPTVDELGCPKAVIRTRTLATFEGPAGVVEIEQACRYTLPGFGHVYPIGHNEFVVFRDHTKLRADPKVAGIYTVPATTNMPSDADHAVEYAEAQPAGGTTMQGRGGMRPHAVAVVAALSVVPLAIVAWILASGNQAPSSSVASLPPARLQAARVEENHSTVPALPSVSPQEPLQTASLIAIPVIADEHGAAHRGLSQLAFAIRPWGDVYVNGKKQGPSPPIKELKLKPGRYTVEIRNGDLPPYRGTIDLRAKVTTKVAHDFTKADPLARKDPGPTIASLSRSPPRFASEDWPR